ncbi:unnamed protein product [Sympodiomycopsis kandeliae]
MPRRKMLIKSVRKTAISGHGHLSFSRYSGRYRTGREAHDTSRSNEVHARLACRCGADHGSDDAGVPSDVVRRGAPQREAQAT